MSGLEIFFANLGAGTFRVGSATNNTGTAAAGSTVILAADNTIYATTMTVDSADTGQVQAIKLGSGTNELNVNTINLGGNGRSSATMDFNGLSGTVKIDEEFSDFFRVQENVGPLVMVLPAKHLIDHGYSPNIKIQVLDLKYDQNDPYLQKYWALKRDGLNMYKSAKDYGRDMLSIERGFLFESKERLDLISNLVKRLGKNTLILFSDVKNGYGKKIQSALLEWNQHTFYIDGGVESTDRDQYKAVMESQEGVVIVASFGTFSTGIDLKNVHHIVFAESTKAEITIRQSIGRGMRKLAEKNKVVVWDLVDQLDGYMVKHGARREEIYRDQRFEISKKEIDLSKKSQRDSE
jgi:superfamily II DNA or RNA helicase